MPTVEELQAELAKRDEQIRGLSTKFQAHEKFVKELGEGVERDTWGNPVSLRKEPAPAMTPSPTSHPFATVFEDPSVADTWLKQQAEALFKAQGFVTNQQLQSLIQTAQRGAYEMARGDALLWRNFDKLVSRERVGADGKPARPYADLGKYDSDFSKRVAKTLQEKRWGEPMHEKAASFDTDWRYSDMQALEWAADLARLEMANEAPAAAASAAAAAGAQAAAGLSPTPAPGPGAATGTRPDFSTLATPEEITAALDAATPAGATP